MAGDVVRLRLLHPGGPPLSSEGQPYVFGLQDAKGELYPGRPVDGGLLAFDFALTVKTGPDAARPVFLGEFAAGPPQDRFVYLSWKSTADGSWVNRLKARLSPITWAMVREAQARDRGLVADMSGRRLGDASPPEWRLA